MTEDSSPYRRFWVMPEFGRVLRAAERPPYGLAEIWDWEKKAWELSSVPVEAVETNPDNYRVIPLSAESVAAMFGVPPHDPPVPRPPAPKRRRWRQRKG